MRLSILPQTFNTQINMNAFAFLMPTPDFARQANCGQYNGYIAFDIQAEDVFCKTIEYDGYWDEKYKLPWSVELESGEEESVECTMHRHTTLKKIGPMIPLTAIPNEAAEGGEFVVFGFDTCHSWNSWEGYDYDKVRAMTLAWFMEAKKMLLKDFCDHLDRCNDQFED